MKLLAIAVCLGLLWGIVGCASEPKRYLTVEQDAAVAALCGPPLGCDIHRRSAPQPGTEI